MVCTKVCPIGNIQIDENSKRQQEKAIDKNMVLIDYLIGDNPESIEVRYEDESIWLTQKMLATLYDVTTLAKYHSEEYRYRKQIEKDRNKELII